MENDRLSKKLKALDKEYSDKENALKQADRVADLASLYEQEKKYQNAATKEGKEKLKEIRESIADLAEEAESERLDTEKETRRTAIEEEIKDNQDKYKTLRDDLLTAQKSMVDSAMAFAKESAKTLGDSTVTLSKSLSSLFERFDKNNDTLMQQGLRKLRTFVDEYKKLMDSITLKPSYSPTTGGNITGTGKTSGGVVVNVTDNGDKYINGKDEAVDYTKELFSAGENAARIWGGVF